MGGVLGITLPIFIIIGLGYACARGGVVDPPAIRVLSRFVTTVPLPALVLKLVIASDPSALANWRYLLGYAGGTLALVAAGYMLLRARGRAGDAAAVHAYGIASSNTGFVGTQVALQAIGPAAGPAIALTIIVENLATLPTFLILGTPHREGDGPAARIRAIADRLVRSPLVIAITVGVLMLATGLALPAPLGRALDLVAGAAAPLALITIGASLGGLRVSGLVGPALALSLTKLVLHPLAVAAGLHLAGVGAGPVRATGVLLAAVSMAAIYPLFAETRREGPLAAATLFLCTLLSFATLNLALLLIDRGVID